MSAVEFVKKHGLQYTRILVRVYPSQTHITDDGRMFINENTCAEHIRVQLSGLVKIEDLKRLIESHELVECYGGYDLAKNVMQITPLRKSSYDLIENLKQAIADVESCK